jgi:hypothetical protein
MRGRLAEGVTQARGVTTSKEGRAGHVWAPTSHRQAGTEAALTTGGVLQGDT